MPNFGKNVVMVAKARGAVKTAAVVVGYGLTYWLGETSPAKRELQSDFDVIKAGASGISREAVDALAGHMGISKKVMAEQILDLSVKTLERKRPNEKLDKKTSSHALEIARIMHHAYEVFEDENRVRRWINTPNKALNNFRPLELFDTLTGMNMVTDVLVRIEEGVYS